MLDDITIAQKAKLLPMDEIAKKLGIEPERLELYGKNKAKVNFDFGSKNAGGKRQAKLILVSAISPTAAGEGKTTVSIGLADALARLGKKACVALREPSLGPVFGMKGGAAGGGYAQVVPMEDINLHFTGDIHAITTANNLLAALVDNHIFQGNALGIDPARIATKRCLDLNDRALRSVVINNGLGGIALPTGGDASCREPRNDGFFITAASEVMAILCLATGLDDLKNRLGNILVAYTFDGKAVRARDINAENAMTILLRDALKPNLVQTLEGTAAFIHGGPFANIAHGCNSIAATKTAMNYADYVVTEAGFGADLGGEKFLDIKCRAADIAPSCAVIVATVRALKMHSGVAKSDLALPDTNAVLRGCENLKKHLQNMQGFGLPVVVAINRFGSDTDTEINVIKDFCDGLSVEAHTCEVFQNGGAGGLDLARAAVDLAEKNTNPKVNFAYDLADGIKEKISAICTKIYGADGVNFSPKAESDIASIDKLDIKELAVVIAKTQYSFSDNPALFGRPTGFFINIREVQLRAGCGFVVAIAGDIMLMPGLPKIPATDGMAIDDKGNITGLY